MATGTGWLILNLFLFSGEVAIPAGGNVPVGQNPINCDLKVHLVADAPGNVKQIRLQFPRRIGNAIPDTSDAQKGAGSDVPLREFRGETQVWRLITNSPNYTYVMDYIQPYVAKSTVRYDNVTRYVFGWLYVYMGIMTRLFSLILGPPNIVQLPGAPGICIKLEAGSQCRWSSCMV